MTNWSERTLRLHSWKTIVLTIGDRKQSTKQMNEKAALAVKDLIIEQKHHCNQGAMYSPLQHSERGALISFLCPYISRFH